MNILFFSVQKRCLNFFGEINSKPFLGNLDKKKKYSKTKARDPKEIEILLGFWPAKFQFAPFFSFCNNDDFLINTNSKLFRETILHLGGYYILSTLVFPTFLWEMSSSLLTNIILRISMFNINIMKKRYFPCDINWNIEIFIHKVIWHLSKMIYILKF